MKNTRDFLIPMLNHGQEKSKMLEEGPLEASLPESEGGPGMGVSVEGTLTPEVGFCCELLGLDMDMIRVCNK